MQETIDISMCVNRMHFAGLLAAVNSIVSNTERPRSISFHFVVGAGESGELLALFRNCFPEPGFRYEVKEFHSTPFLEDFIRAGQDFTYATHASQVMNFSRFYLGQIYPQLGKLIYLDADLIVQGDVAELFQQATLKKHALAAVAICSFNDWQGGINKKSRLARHLDFEEPVFNNGIYVTDLRIWQQQKILEQLEGWVRMHKQSLADLVFGTQSIMNLGFHRNFEQLPPEWNVRPLGSNDKIPEEKLKAAKILHWAGKRKPWLADGLYKEYWEPYAFDVDSSAARRDARP